MPGNQLNSADQLEGATARARAAFEVGDYKTALAGFLELKRQANSAAWNAEIEISQRRLWLQKPPLFSILDEMSEIGWGDVASLSPLLPNNWRAELEKHNWPIFVESLWLGPKEAWKYQMVNMVGDKRKPTGLDKLLREAKARSRQIIFWNKEDPLHFEHFKHVAAVADVVLTTDSNCVSRYHKLFPKARVGCLPFAANISVCNPVRRIQWARAGTICFAGSNYISGHNDRVIQLKLLLPLIELYSGVIYDRQSEHPAYRFSERYKSFVRPAIGFAEMVTQYKSFKFFLNVNTVTDSPTMLARRVYELLACGTPVISWPSAALTEQFEGIVLTATTAGRAKNLLEDYLNDEFKWLKLSHLGYRAVMNKHSYKHRLLQMAKFAKLEVIERQPRISILMSTMRPQLIDRIADNIGGQSHANLEAIISLQGYSAAERERLANCLKQRNPALPLTFLESPAEMALGARYNKMAALATGEYLAKFDDDDFYFQNYLSDLILPFAYTDAGIVGKLACFYYFQENDETWWRSWGRIHAFVDLVTGATMLWRRDISKAIRFQETNHGEDTNFQRAAQAKGIRIYSADPFNYVIARSVNLAEHTYRPERDLRTDLKFISNGFRRDLFVN